MKDKDAALLAFIEEEYRKTGFAPTYREVVDQGEWYSTSTVHRAVKRLEEAGAIIFRDARKDYIPARWRELISEGTKEHYERVRDQDRREIAMLNDKIRRMNELMVLRETTKPLQIVVTTEEYERLKDGIQKRDDPNAVIQKDFPWVDKTR